MLLYDVVKIGSDPCFHFYQFLDLILLNLVLCPLLIRLSNFKAGLITLMSSLLLIQIEDVVLIIVIHIRIIYLQRLLIIVLFGEILRVTFNFNNLTLLFLAALTVDLFLI